MPQKLKKIQEKYFDILEDYFGQYYNYTLKKDLNLLEFYKFNKRVPIFGEGILFDFYQLGNELEKLWKNNSNAIKNEICNMGGLKTYYYPHYFSLIEETIGKKKPSILDLALYSDSIFIEDPIFRRVTDIDLFRHELSYRYNQILGYSFQLFKLKDVIFADLDQPIIGIVPTQIKYLFGGENHNAIVDLEAVNFFNRNLKIEFNSFDDVLNYLENYKIENYEDYEKIFKKSGPNARKLVKNVSLYLKHIQNQHDIIPPKYMIFDFLLNIGVTNAFDKILYTNAKHLDSIPIYNTKELWIKSIESMKNDQILLNNKIKNKIPKESLLINILNNKNFNFLNNVTPDLLIKLRKEGELQNIRNFMFENLNKIQGLENENISEIIKDFKYNLQEAMKRHSAEIRNIKKRYIRNIKVKTSQAFLSGTLSIMAFYYPPIILLGSILGATTFKEIIDILNEKNIKIEDLSKKPIGILYNISEKNKKNIV